MQSHLQLRRERRQRNGNEATHRRERIKVRRLKNKSRLVLGYLLENGYNRTRETLMSECPAVAELTSLSPPKSTGEIYHKYSTTI